MSDIIIDPPVGPLSEEGAIRAWVEELEDRLKTEKDGTVQNRIHAEIERAKGWLTPDGEPVGLDDTDGTA